MENQEKLDALLAKLDAYDALDELKAELQGMTLPAIGRMTDQAKMEKLLNAYNNAANSEELRQYLTDAEKNKADAIKARLDTLCCGEGDQCHRRHRPGHERQRRGDQGSERCL